MSKLLEEALSKLAELPESEQDSIATWLINELESDERWRKSLRVPVMHLGSWRMKL